MITSVYQSFSALPEHQTTWHTSQLNRFNALRISGRISSQPAVITVLTARKISAAVMVFTCPSVRWCDNIRYFAAETPDVLPEHFVDLSAIGIQFIPDILPRLHFGLFHREGCELSRLSVQWMQRRLGFVLQPRLVAYFLCLNSFFHPIVPPQGYFFCQFAAYRLFRSYMWAEDETEAAMNRSYSSTSGVRSRSYRDKDAKVFLTSLSARALFGRTS